MFNTSLMQILLICFMIPANCKYLYPVALKVFLCFFILLTFRFAGYSQCAPDFYPKIPDVLAHYHEYINYVSSTPVVCFSMPPDPLTAYRQFKKEKRRRDHVKLNYATPDNQLMSWPNYPLTAAQIDQRNKQWEQDNKLSNAIAKDVITSILSKKKKIAVLPKF